MRRFITYVAEVDPELIGTSVLRFVVALMMETTLGALPTWTQLADVVPNEKPPFGFPCTEDGEQICAKCNTAMGCVRPLLDKEGNQLK